MYIRENSLKIFGTKIDYIANKIINHYLHFFIYLCLVCSYLLFFLLVLDIDDVYIFAAISQ